MWRSDEQLERNFERAEDVVTKQDQHNETRETAEWWKNA